MSDVVKIVRFEDFAGRPWRNGGGITRELLTGPSPESWQWRVSVADIERDAPFSLWAGVQRWFVPIEGGGAELRVDGLPHRVELGGEPLAFEGNALTTCRLIAGPTRDLNLMLRGAAGSLRRAFDAQDWSPGSAQCGLFTARAGTCLADGATIELPARALAWWTEAPEQLRYSAASNTADPLAGWWMAATPQAAGL